MAKEKAQAEITSVLGISKDKFIELAKRIQHNRIDTGNMAQLIKTSMKGYDKEAVAIGYLLGRTIADNERGQENK